MACFNHKKFTCGNGIEMIPIYIQWNSSTWSRKKRYVAIGRVCPECNTVFFYDRNDFSVEDKIQ